VNALHFITIHFNNVKLIRIRGQPQLKPAIGG